MEDSSVVLKALSSSQSEFSGWHWACARADCES